MRWKILTKLAAIIKWREERTSVLHILSLPTHCYSKSPYKYIKWSSNKLEPPAWFGNFWQAFFLLHLANNFSGLLYMCKVSPDFMCSSNRCFVIMYSKYNLSFIVQIQLESFSDTIIQGREILESKHVQRWYCDSCSRLIGVCHFKNKSLRCTCFLLVCLF